MAWTLPHWRQTWRSHFTRWTDRQHRKRYAAAPKIIALGFLASLGTTANAADVCHNEMFEGDSFTVCPFETKSQTLLIATADDAGTPLRSFDALAIELGSSASRVRFAMNAGMFDDEGHAIGLLIERGVQRHKLNTARGSGNFHMKPNGVFSQDEDGTLHVETAAQFKARKGKSRWATQSGPMLVIDGMLHPMIAEDGPSRYVRNGVGAVDSRIAFFVISNATVSFGKFARLFRDGLHCPNALYFDGSVSSVWVPSQDRKDTARLLGPMIAILDR